MRASKRLATIVALLLVLAGCAAVDRLSGVSEARELQRIGQPAAAIVLEVWDTGITRNKDPVIGLRVEVHPAQGEPYQATIEKSVVSRVDIPQFQPGSRLAVRVDPANPARVGLDVYKY